MAKKWTKDLVLKELKELQQGYQENGEEMGDDIAFDIADSMMHEPGFADAIRKYMGVTDVQGYIANWIA